MLKVDWADYKTFQSNNETGFCAMGSSKIFENKEKKTTTKHFVEDDGCIFPFVLVYRLCLG